MTPDVAFVPLAYLAGSIPTGVLLARRAGVDVRQTGSGNVGATNVARTAGNRLGVLTLLGDLVKGAFPVLAARAFGASEEVVAASAIAAVAGHVYSVFLGFRGGKGVATGLGVLLALAPAATPIPLIAFASTFALSRIVSLASIASALTSPAAVAWLGYPPPTVIAAIAIAALILWGSTARTSIGSVPEPKGGSAVIADATAQKGIAACEFGIDGITKPMARAVRSGA